MKTRKDPKTLFCGGRESIKVHEAGRRQLIHSHIKEMRHTSTKASISVGIKIVLERKMLP